MEWLTAWVIKIFAGWTLAEFSRGILVNFFSSLVTGGSGMLYSKLKGRKAEEEQLKECLNKAISKHVKNRDIAKYISYRDEEKYLSALKTEILTGEHTFAAGSDDAKIVETLQKELSKKPFFTLRLIRLYGTEIREQSKEALDKLNAQIRELQKINQQNTQILAAVQNIYSRTGYTLNITDSMSGGFDCPIPDIHFSRAKLVGEVKDILLRQGAIYLYGGYKTGKSILCCLVAGTLTDYAKVRIPLDYKNILSIKEIVQRYDITDKIVFVIDGIAYTDESVILDLCRFLKQQDANRWLFLLNGRQPLSQYTTVATGVEEHSVAALTQEEVAELVLMSSQALTPAITALSAGSPMIAILMVQMLEQQGWPSTVQSLYALFSFSAKSTFNDKFRSILRQIISNQDAIRLLNRLLLVHHPFTREQSRNLAGIEPSITLPDTCFDDLNNVAITDNGNGEYMIVPTFAKTLTPDLLQRERHNCDRWLADQILAKKKLDEMDVVRVLNYMLDGGEYDSAGLFFISCLTNIGAQSASYRFLNGIWIDLPLPAEMSLTIKILIRIQQIIFFCVHQEKPHTYPVGDLEKLITEPGIEQNLLYFAYQILYYYYGSRGDVERSTKYVEASSTIPVNPALNLFGGDTLWMTLFKVTTTADLFAWFNLYAKEGYPTYDFKEEMSNKAVSNIYQSCTGDDAEQQLKSVIERAAATPKELWPFVVSAEANLIFYYGTRKQFDDAEQVYQQSPFQNEEFACLLLNYAMGMCYYNNNRLAEAKPFFKKVTEVKNIDLNAINVLYSYVFYSAIVANDSTQEAAAILEQLVAYPDFEKVFVESERLLIYGELAIALWNNNERIAAVNYMLKVEHYLWSCRDNMSDGEKVHLVRLSVLVSSYYGQLKGLPVNPDNARPRPSMFILENSSLKDEYSDFRVLATTIYLYELQKEYLWDSGYTMTLLDHSLDLYKNSVIETHPEYVTLFLNYIPELLTAGRFDDVRYVISQSSRAVKKFPDVIQHPEGAVLTGSLFYVLLYRLDKHINAQPFDDSAIVSILSDFISVTPADCAFATYLLDVMEGRQQLDIRHSDDAGHQSLLVFYGLNEGSTVKQWFVALQRMYVSLITMNNSHTCGKFLETLSTDLLRFVVNNNSSDFNTSQYQKTVDRMQKYVLFDRARAALAGFYYLMKNPPAISKEVEDLIDMN